MKHFVDAIHRAAHSAAPHLTQDLRHGLIEDGWDREVVGGTRVKYSSDGFSAHTHAAHSEGAFDHEYGTQDTPPTASIRQYGKRGSRAERILLTSIAREIGDLL